MKEKAQIKSMILKFLDNVVIDVLNIFQTIR